MQGKECWKYDIIKNILAIKYLDLAGYVKIHHCGM